MILHWCPDTDPFSFKSQQVGEASSASAAPFTPDFTYKLERAVSVGNAYRLEV